MLGNDMSGVSPSELVQHIHEPQQIHIEREGLRETCGKRQLLQLREAG